MTTNVKDWWGNFKLDHGERCLLRIGSLRLWVARYPGEWRVAIERGSDHLDESVEPLHLAQGEEPSEDAEVHRFASRSGEDTLSLRPILADRSVVTRPEEPFHLLPGDEIEIFVSTALWVDVSLGEGLLKLLEVPTVRNSDTWFGPSTREGELAYASRTAARLNLANVPKHPARATTGVVLRNQAEDKLTLERINLPVPALSLFQDEEGVFWTEVLAVERDRGGKMAQVQIGRRPPERASSPRRISPPRSPEAQNVLIRAMSSLLR